MLFEYLTKIGKYFNTIFTELSVNLGCEGRIWNNLSYKYL